MIAYAPSALTAPTAAIAPTTPKPPHRQLAVAAAVAAIGHALLLWGLPRLPHDISGLKSPALETRIIAAPLADQAQDSNFTPAAPMPPAPPPQTTPQPPQPPAPTPAPTPEPALSPAADAPAPAQPDTAAPAPSTSPSAAPAAPSPATSSLASMTDQPTLINAIPTVTFGGSAGAQPVRPMLTGNQTKTVLGQMATAVEGRARLARAADLSYETRYTVGGETVPGRTTLAWRHDRHYYQAKWVENNVKLGNDSYLSTGAVAPQGLAPVTGNWDHAQREAIQIDYAQQIAQLKKPNQPVGSVPIQTGVQDRVSAALHLGAIIAGQPDRFAIGARVQLPVLIDGHTENWTFTVQAQSHLQALEQQDVPVLHLVHQATSAPPGSALPQPVAVAAAPAASGPAAGASSVQLGPVVKANAPASPNTIKQLDLWLGPTLDFLPVRMRIERFNGHVADHLLRSAVEQRVLSSLPPPADALPSASGAPAPSPAPAPFPFPNSGGG